MKRFTGHNEKFSKYKSIYKDKDAFWDNMKTEIEQFCNDQNINFKMYFDHKKQRKAYSYLRC